MKNETARREIEALDYYLQNHTDDYSEESHTAMMMAIQSLEQEPCDVLDINVGDMISRQAVLDLAKKGVLVSNGNYESVCKAINELPSVNPQPCEDAISRDAVWDVMQELWGTSGELLDELMALPPVKPLEPKIGKWIYKSMEGTFCSECDEPSVWKFNYCPNCGAKMIELQESGG